jgi:hypothetical protein
MVFPVPDYYNMDVIVEVRFRVLALDIHVYIAVPFLIPPYLLHFYV